jgi:hypothetical protein
MLNPMGNLPFNKSVDSNTIISISKTIKREYRKVQSE